mmetsp:Transcript_23560/g.81594  ORF Transcript_23560/g.81594 Transcript_23560/m.81594 type:complete len:220 (+) Transcript_23560:2028-2687(+)
MESSITSLGLIWPSARSSKNAWRALVKRRARESEAARRHAQHQRQPFLSARIAAALRPLPSGRILLSRDWLNAFIFRQPAAGPSSFLLVCLCEAHRLMPRQRFHFGGPTAPAKDFCDLCRRPARADLAHVIFDCVAPALVAVRLRWKTAVGNALRGAVAVPGRDRLLGAIGLAPLTGRPACELADIATDLTRLFIRHWGAWEFAHRDEIEALPPVQAGA